MKRLPEPLADIWNDAFWLARFWSGVVVRAENECWPWLSVRGKYGQIDIGLRRYVTATRWSWSIFHRLPFPAHLYACHSCDNTWCVNPRHIWPGTQSENMLDASRKGRLPHAAKTECKKGHPLSGQNLRIDARGRRVCRSCANENARQHEKRNPRGPRPEHARRMYRQRKARA